MHYKIEEVGSDHIKVTFDEQFVVEMRGNDITKFAQRCMDKARAQVSMNPDAQMRETIESEAAGKVQECASS